MSEKLGTRNVSPKFNIQILNPNRNTKLKPKIPIVDVYLPLPPKIADGTGFIQSVPTLKSGNM